MPHRSQPYPSTPRPALNHISENPVAKILIAASCQSKPRLTIRCLTVPSHSSPMSINSNLIQLKYFSSSALEFTGSVSPKPPIPQRDKRLALPFETTGHVPLRTPAYRQHDFHHATGHRSRSAVATRFVLRLLKKKAAGDYGCINRPLW